MEEMITTSRGLDALRMAAPSGAGPSAMGLLDHHGASPGHGPGCYVPIRLFLTHDRAQSRTGLKLLQTVFRRLRRELTTDRGLIKLHFNMPHPTCKTWPVM